MKWGCEMGFDFSAMGTPYSSQRRIIEDFVNILDMHIYYYYKYHPWVGPDSSMQNMMGVVVSREEFEGNLMKATDSRAFSLLTADESQELLDMREYFLSRIALTEASPEVPILRAVKAFGLNSFELMVFMTMLTCELNKKYEKLFVYLQDDITKKSPSVETAIRLFAEPGDVVSEYFGFFDDNSVLMNFFAAPSEGTLCTKQLRLSKSVFAYVTGSGDKNSSVYYDHTKPLHDLYIDENINECIKSTVRLTENKTALIYLKGKKGSGRKFHVKHCAKSMGEDVVFLNAGALTEADKQHEAFNNALCTALLNGAALCITEFQQLLSEDNAKLLNAFSELLNRSRKHLGTHIFITAEEKWYDAVLDESIVKIDMELPETNEQTRLALWESFMQGKSFDSSIDPQEMAAKFRFTPGQVGNAVMRSVDLTKMSGSEVITPEVLHNSCYDQVVVGLNTLASPIKPAYDWDDLVLPQSEVKLLKEACTHIKYRNTIYNVWGFGKKAAYGRGLSMLFSGPPGTGKTMAAQVITNQLHMQMYKVQISQIVSKYIGETEKNLRRVFTEAKNANCILFFDEMDALFGKRSEVKDSHDRHANIETAYLLQQMEEYDGVVLMATNLLQNIDEAFMRRINFVIAFPFPDEATRKMLWMKMLDTDAPISEDVNFAFLADNFRMAGGNIKNCVIHAAFLAAAENVPINMRHLITSVVTEQRKNGAVVLKEDLKEYADIVFGS